MVVALGEKALVLTVLFRKAGSQVGSINEETCRRGTRRHGTWAEDGDEEARKQDKTETETKNGEMREGEEGEGDDEKKEEREGTREAARRGEARRGESTQHAKHKRGKSVVHAWMPVGRTQHPKKERTT